MARASLTSRQVRRGVLLGQTISRERKRAGLTQAELARRAGVNLQALVKVEQGHVANPGVFSVVAIAQVLEVPMARLIESVDTCNKGGLSTLGYEGLDVAVFLERLDQMQTELVVDVRLNPLSRKPGLSKTKLGEALAERGIGYKHFKSLGNPKQNRAAFAGDQLIIARERFRSLLSTSEAQGALSEIALLARNQHVVLICFEKNEAQCHRAVVAEELLQLG